MFDFIKNAFNGIKDFIVDTIVNPVKQLFTDIKDGYWFTGFIDFCVDSPIGAIVSGIICVVTIVAFAGIMAVELTGFVAIASFVVGYIAMYGAMFLFFYSCIQQICKALGLTGPVQLTDRKRARVVYAQLVA